MNMIWRQMILIFIKPQTMQKQITIEQLSPYFPYDLHLKSKPGGTIFKMGLYNNMLGKGIETRTIDQCLGMVPLLRPLSSLTKEITHNGETFMPIDHFEYGDDDAPGITFKNAYRDLQTIATYNVQHDIQFLPAGVVQLLISWHFDIHGLIDAGLALPIND